MTKFYLLPALLCLVLAGCKKECESESYGNLTIKNLTQQNLKIKVNNAIPNGCLSSNSGNLAAGAECGAELTANLLHHIVVRTDSNALYYEFDMSVGPCGDKVFEIQ
jgi:hypothetical protein